MIPLTTLAERLRANSYPGSLVAEAADHIDTLEAELSNWQKGLIIGQVMRQRVETLEAQLSPLREAVVTLCHREQDWACPLCGAWIAHVTAIRHHPTCLVLQCQAALHPSEGKKEV